MRWSDFHMLSSQEVHGRAQNSLDADINEDCLICKAFLSTKSQRNESSNTQTATWGDLSPDKLSLDCALPPTPSRHCLCRGDTQVGQRSCWGKGESLGTKGHGFCSTHHDRWTVTWGWLPDFSWHAAWGGTTVVNAQHELQCSVTPILPRAPCTIQGDGWLMALRWFVLV